MINKKNFLKYLDLFAWSYLNLHDVIEQLALKLEINKKAQKTLTKFHLLYRKNIQYIKKEIKFYQDQYQKTKILNPIKI